MSDGSLFLSGGRCLLDVFSRGTLLFRACHDVSKSLPLDANAVSGLIEMSKDYLQHCGARSGFSAAYELRFNEPERLMRWTKRRALSFSTLAY
jgi:hypothetical protein